MNDKSTITEEKYYQLMGSMRKYKSFQKLHQNWYLCFEYILRSFKCNFSKKSINSLFYDFDMSNWEALHKENTEYKNYTKSELIESFASECSYISDRASYDRLFRTHWLFRNAFEKELNNIRFPRVFGK
jgi:hypothetical protein